MKTSGEGEGSAANSTMDRIEFVKQGFSGADCLRERLDSSALTAVIIVAGQPAEYCGRRGIGNSIT